jgi:steroid 5-alpha reductase family enzyme
MLAVRGLAGWGPKGEGAEVLAPGLAGLPVCPSPVTQVFHLPSMVATVDFESVEAALFAGLWTSAAFSFGFQPINYALSYWRIADNFTGLVEFIPAALLGIRRAVGPGSYWTLHPRQIVVTLMLITWSLRLGIFLIVRMYLRSSTDSRMDKLRASPRPVNPGLATFWLVHGTWGFVVSLPVTLANAVQSDLQRPPNPLDALGVALWAVGFILEAFADNKKLQSYITAVSAGRVGDTKFINKPRDTGYALGAVWRWTRHPNFFGEISCWTGIALVASNVSLDSTLLQALAWASPVFTTALMLFEAVLLTERKNNRRYGQKEASGWREYRTWRQRTSVIVPCPPSIYMKLPSILRRTIFCEWGIFDHGLERISHESDDVKKTKCSGRQKEHDS